MSGILGPPLCAGLASGVVALAMYLAGLSLNLPQAVGGMVVLWVAGAIALRPAALHLPNLDRSTLFFLTVAIGLPLVFLAIFAFAILEYGVHGVLDTNHAFNWPVYLGQHLLVMIPGLTAGAGFFARTVPQGVPPVPEAVADIEERMRQDWWDWFWLQPLILADIAVISSIILGAGTLARRLSAWFAVNLITLSLIQLAIWWVLYRRGKPPGFLVSFLLIGLPFANWARLPTLQEHGPEAVGGAVGMWTLAMLSAVAISARRLWPMVAVVCFSTASVVIAYFRHQHADAWFEQALISMLSGSFCVALVFALHGRAHQTVRDQNILATALRRERQANESAQRETRRRHRVLRAVGHDLRQPLSALQLWLFSAERKSGDSQADLAAASNAVSSAHEILDSISQIAWMNDAEKEPKFRSLSLAGLLSDLCSELRLNARDAGIELICTAPDVMVRSDPLLLRRILRNFVVNAIRYGRQRVILDATVNGDLVEIRVSDDGPGIPADIQEAIFEEFGRGEPDDGEGFGVGLAVAKDLASALGHRLFLRSSPGEGSTFGLHAPLVRPAPA